jgi:3D (Asp-Asp-Asp) domain-containing protein
MQGTGLAENGQYITIDWINSDVQSGNWVFTNGIGGQSGKPEAWQTVATGDLRLPQGTKIVIEAYPGIIFVVNDTGSGVGANHIDVFIGAVPIEEADQYGTKNSRIAIIK